MYEHGDFDEDLQPRKLMESSGPVHDPIDNWSFVRQSHIQAS